MEEGIDNVVADIYELREGIARVMQSQNFGHNCRISALLEGLKRRYEQMIEDQVDDVSELRQIEGYIDRVQEAVSTAERGGWTVSHVSALFHTMCELMALVGVNVARQTMIDLHLVAVRS